ncbi:unnamed protein product [Gordionus sp. m RMFG-2023]
MAADKWYTPQDLVENKKNFPNFLKHLYKNDCTPGYDIVIHLSKDNTKYKAHKFVLACHSKFFHTLLSNSDTYKGPDAILRPSLAETFWQDKDTMDEEIILGPHTALTADIFTLLLKFIYTLDVDINSSNAERLWAAGQAMGMPHLQALCVDKEGVKASDNGKTLLNNAVPEDHKRYDAPIPSSLQPHAEKIGADIPPAPATLPVSPMAGTTSTAPVIPTAAVAPIAPIAPPAAVEPIAPVAPAGIVPPVEAPTSQLHATPDPTEVATPHTKANTPLPTEGLNQENSESSILLTSGSPTPPIENKTSIKEDRSSIKIPKSSSPTKSRTSKVRTPTKGGRTPTKTPDSASIAESEGSIASTDRSSSPTKKGGKKEKAAGGKAKGGAKKEEKGAKKDDKKEEKGAKKDEKKEAKGKKKK